MLETCDECGFDAAEYTHQDLFGTLRGVRGFADPRAITLPSGQPVWYQMNGEQLVLPFRPPVDNLGIYPDLANYLSYRIQSPLSNDNFLSACKRMPVNYYRMSNINKRAMKFHRSGEPSPYGEHEQYGFGRRNSAGRPATVASEH